MKRVRNADGGKVRRLCISLEKPVRRDLDRPLADLLDEATEFLGLLGPGEPGDPRKKRWLAKWAIHVVCEALLRQGAHFSLPWAATVYPAARVLRPGESEEERVGFVNEVYRAARKGGA